MSSIITQQQLIDAQLDAATLEEVVNGAASPGTVTSRLGTPLKTIAKLQVDIAADISEGLIKTVVDLISTANAVDIDLDGPERIYVHEFTENTTFTFSNPASAGFLTRFELWLENDGTGRTPTWPASVKWPNGTEPDVSTINEKNVLVFSTIDGGTTWYGALVQEAMA